MRLRHSRPPSSKDLELALEVRPSALPGLLERTHLADLAHWLLEFDEDEAWTVFATLPPMGRGELLAYAAESLRQQLVRRMEADDLVEIVELLPPDDVVDLLALTDTQTSEQVLHQVDFDRAAGLRQLAEYAEDSAGGIMTPEVDVFTEDERVGDVIKALRKEDTDHFEDGAGVFVVDGGHRPVGFVSDRELLTTPIHTALAEVMETDLVTVGADDDQEQVALTLSKYSLAAVPVVDERGSLIGIVTADDALGVLEEEAEEDFLKLVGTAPEQQTRLPIARRVRQRSPLMGLTVVGGLFTAKLLELAGAGGTGEFGTADLLRYIPIILGLAGNVGIQSSTILVRGFATGEVDSERELSVVGSEVMTGATIGILCGLVTALFATFTEAGDSGLAWVFGIAIGVAIAIAVTWAAVLGCLVPLGCHRWGVDPAVVAGPFLITMSDVSGTAIFMVVAHMIVAMGGGVA
ncbi:MAG: magnesium transporter [Planctomycetota bacterium]|jgi:magnesium transporter